MMSADNRSPSLQQIFSPRAGKTLVVPNARGTPASAGMAQSLSAHVRAATARATPTSGFIDEEASVASSASNSDVPEHGETDYEIINDSDVEDITAEMNRVQFRQKRHHPNKPKQCLLCLRRDTLVFYTPTKKTTKIELLPNFLCRQLPKNLLTSPRAGIKGSYL